MTLSIEIDPWGVACLFIIVANAIVVSAVMINAKIREREDDDE